jgi:periplasmic divalent cation tolerance protein
MSSHIVVFVTAGKVEEAKQIARDLIDRRLAACVNILPRMTSIYRWQREVCEDTETLLVIKTDRRRYPELEARVKQLHSYQVPEIIALSIDAGSKPYLDWVSDSTDELEKAGER